MKRSRFTFLVVCLMLVVMAYPAFAQQKPEDVAGIYKNYFKLLIDKEFTKAWEGLTDESRLVVAELIAREGKISPDKALAMLNMNENGLRDKYFGAFQESIKELLDEIYSQGKFTVKSKNDSSAIVTIEVQKDPKDFGMVKDKGKWKVNFFKDLEPPDEKK